jgi:hypothetical protein
MNTKYLVVLDEEQRQHADFAFMCKLGSQFPVNFESPKQQNHTALYLAGMAVECGEGR